MCMTCGCTADVEVVFTNPRTGRQVTMPRLNTFSPVQATNFSGFTPLEEKSLAHPHISTMVPDTTNGGAIHAAVHGTTVALEAAILGKNQQLADRNRSWLREQGIVALNLMSSPGSGKTTLLERTIRDLDGEIPISVIEGDQATANDAERIRATGCMAIQINTGTGCHLEADMLEHALTEIKPPAGSVVMIENVGNLVCPALFDLGESARVVILAVTEGEDKPAKYPHMFRSAEIMLLNKIDLLPYLHFDVDRCIEYARSVNPGIRIFQVSAQTGTGMTTWYDWLRTQRQSMSAAAVVQAKGLQA